MLSDRFRVSSRARAAILGLTAIVISGCTVQPLYQADADGVSPMATALQSISVKAPDDRSEQLVRNHLIFLLGRGAGEPVNPAYELDLRVRKTVNLGVTLSAHYTLTETANPGAPSKSGRVSTSAAFDELRQGYSREQAEDDAEERAARELAEMIRLSIAQHLSR